VNILRTIKKEENPEWVALFFKQGPHIGGTPNYPPNFPLPGHLRGVKIGAFLYVVFRWQIIGYGQVAQIRPHYGNRVGTPNYQVRVGDELVLIGPLIRMPVALRCRGFQGFRTTSVDLHLVAQTAAQAEITRLGL